MDERGQSHDWHQANATKFRTTDPISTPYRSLGLQHFNTPFILFPRLVTWVCRSVRTVLFSQTRSTTEVAVFVWNIMVSESPGFLTQNRGKQETVFAWVSSCSRIWGFPSDSGSSFLFLRISFWVKTFLSSQIEKTRCTSIAARVLRNPS